MFMFPEPEPVDYFLTDVPNVFLTDGVFHHGIPSPTHKYVAKQLKPIKRTLSDSVAPLRELDSRTLDQWIKNEKEGFVDHCSRDEGLVFETLKTMPKWKHSRKIQLASLWLFPRSQQYELWHIRDKRLKDFAKRQVIAIECPRKEETIESSSECGLLKPPFWWRDKTTKPQSLPVGNIDDYRFEKLRESESHAAKISERLHLDDTRKYIPGVIHRVKNPEDTSMKDTLDRADAFRVATRIDETSLDIDTSDGKCPVQKPSVVPVHRDSNWVQDAQDDDKTLLDSDGRWQPLYETVDFSGNDLQRQEELRALTKPFLHDLHTWYSKNKPTKLSLPVTITSK